MIIKAGIEMSYASKIGIYQGDCKVLSGKHQMFSCYIEEFAKTINTGDHGLDLGTGPSGCNAKFFTLAKLDGCDVEIEVIDSLSSIDYMKTFLYVLGKDTLPYGDETLDFVVCSCVIQHLNSFHELEMGISDISRVLKPSGSFYLMFKVGTNNTILTHHNEYYNEERSFRVFSLKSIIDLASASFKLISHEYLLDENHIAYCCTIFQKL